MFFMHAVTHLQIVVELNCLDSHLTEDCFIRCLHLRWLLWILSEVYHFRERNSLPYWTGPVLVCTDTGLVGGCLPSTFPFLPFILSFGSTPNEYDIYEKRKKKVTHTQRVRPIDLRVKNWDECWGDGFKYIVGVIKVDGALSLLCFIKKKRVHSLCTTIKLLIIALGSIWLI